ncbi:MAG: sulfatase-like hydrolase/transferase, partial [Limisphaerales bacterium]
MFSKCDRLGFWKSCVTILMVGTACHPDILAQPEPLSDPLPNILLLYADDLGYGDVACYNPSRGLIPTPHIDRLAREGMRWTDAHASSAVCSPSRYTLLTGRYHWRTRLQSGIVGLWGKPVIAPHRRTLASLAKSKNYRTQCIGKWHLGWEWPIPEEHLTFMRHSHTKDVALKAGHVRIWEEIFTQRIGSGPTERGFDHYFGTDVPNWPPYCFIE